MSRIAEAKNVFIVGIKGVAMANIAIMLCQMGKSVSGSDTDDSQITDALVSSHKFTIFPLEEKLPDGVDLVIYSAAHKGSQSTQVQEAKSKNISRLNQAQVIAEFIRMTPRSVAVCGCHGKTGTSALLAYGLIHLGAKVSWLIGAPSFKDTSKTYEGGQWDSQAEIFVFEADEYAVDVSEEKTVKLRYYTPTHILCTNIDFDHPDVYRDIDHTKAEFLDFFTRVSSTAPIERRLILCARDANTVSLLSHFGTNSYALYADNQSFMGPLPGEKNRLNAVGVVETLKSLGYDEYVSQQALMEFGGVKRRMEHIASAHGIEYYDDYGHHPAEVTAIIQAFREKYPGRRLVVLFQSHTFSRTQSLKEEFIHALSKADVVHIDEIFPSARERAGVEKITAKDLESLARSHGFTHVTGFTSRTELINTTKSVLREGDVVVTLGAGDIYKVAKELL